MLQQADLGSKDANPPASNLLSAYLTRGVDYFRREVLPAIFDHFAECILDGGVIAIDKMLVHESHCQRRFAWSQADLSSIAILSKYGWKGSHRQIDSQQ